MSKPLRRIVDPVVAAGPAGVRIRTRIHPSAGEAALTAIGTVLGGLYRGELAGRIRLGRLDHKALSAWRAQRKQALTAVSSSRWAGAITRAVEDQYQLGMRGLAAHVRDLGAAVEVLEARCACRPGELAPIGGDGSGRRGRSQRRRGYRTASERFAKTRRLAVLRDRLATAQEALVAGCPSIVVGGKRLWRHRNYLGAAGMTEQQWRDRWDAARMFLTADGESGKAGGNETIRVDEHGRLRVKTPGALADQWGAHVSIAAPVRFSHCGDQWAARVAARRAVRYDISYDPGRKRWYLDASWTISPAPVPELDDLRSGPVLGVDLNADHLAACVLDAAGNPIGAPVTIAVDTAGLRASRRDGRVRWAITALLDVARQHHCSAIVMENLNFADARATGPRNPGPRRRGQTAAPHRGRHPHRKVPDPADQHEHPPGCSGHRYRPGLHQPLGCPALAQTLTPTDFRPGHHHRASRGGGCDRQTWTRLGDQATAGRTPHPTADACGHTTGQARKAAEHHTTTVRKFWLTATLTTTTRHAGPPENTHRQRPTPFGPHRTHS